MPPFWSPPTAQATRPRPRLLAENGRTGLESGPQPHIIASPPGTGAPIDRINYTPDTGEVHPPGVLAPIDKLNYSLVPHDDLNYMGQLGQTSSPPGGQPQQGGAAAGGGAAGVGMSSALQPGQGQGLKSDVWKNTGQPGAGADSIVNSPGTPAGTDSLGGRYSEAAALRTNQFSPGQPPLSPTPYGTGPGPRAQASGPTMRPMDQRASMTGNLGNWGQGMGGGQDEGDDESDPLDAIYGGNGDQTGQTQVAPAGDQTTPVPSQAPTTAPAGYRIEKVPPDAPGGGPPRDSNNRIVEQQIWLKPSDPNSGRPDIPLGQYDAQTKPGTTERTYHPYALAVQESMSPSFKADNAKAKAGQSSTNQIITIVGKDGKKHSVLVDKANPGEPLHDYGVAEPDKTTTGQGDEKIVGGDTLHPTVLVKQADGSYIENTARSAQLAAENKEKADQKASQDELDRQTRLDASQSKPFTVYNDSSGQSWMVNTQTGEKEKLGVVDPKQGIYENNGRLVKIGDDGKPTEIYKPPPGYDLHYDTYGKAIAVNKEDPSQPPITAYQPEDYEEQRATAKQKALLDIEKVKSDLATAKVTQTDSRIKMMDALQKLEHPEARFMGSSDIYLPSGASADVQRYNPETKTSTYEHVSGGELSPEQKANAARMRSMLDELDKAMAGGDTNKANALATQIQKDQAQPTQQQAKPQEEQPGILNLDAIQQRAVESPAGAVMKPGWPGEDPRLQGVLQPPTKRTTAAGDIASYDEHGVLTGIDYRNTAPPGYEELGSTLEGGLDQGQPEEEQPAEEEPDQLGEDYWAKRRQQGLGMGTDIPQGGQGNPKPAGRPGYDTTPTPTPVPPSSPPPGGAFPSAPPMAGAPPNAAGGASDPSALAADPSYNPLKPPDLAALGPPGGGGGTAPGIMPGPMPESGGQPGGQPGALPNLNDPLFQFAMQRRQAAQGGGAAMGGGQDEQPAQPGGSSYAGWTPPVPQEDVAGIGHRFGQQMDVGEPQHSGVDLQAVEGTPTIAPVDGVVQRVEYNPQGLGITVVLQGKDGTIHKLGHLKKTEAYPGLTVSQGQDLQSQVGSTGNTTGSHLHWAVKTPDGQPTDPTASLGAMANLPPVPGTQMMGPPGGSAAPGGTQPTRGPLSSGAAGPGPLAVPSAQGAPPPPAAQPPSPGLQPQMMGQGAGADDGGLGSSDLPEEEDPHPLSPFNMRNKNPYSFQDRNLMLLWNQQHKRWVDAQMKKQGTFRTGSQNAPTEPPPEGQEEEPDEHWDPDFDQTREYRAGEGMPGRGTSPGKVPGSEIGGRYQRSEEMDNPNVQKTRRDVSPYREGTTNPNNPNSPEGKSWQRQKNWWLRKQQGQNSLNDKLDALTKQGWPQEAVDEMKSIGRAPTKDEIEAIRAKYKNLPAGEAQPTGEEKPEVQDIRDWETEWERKRAAGEPTTPPPRDAEPAQPTAPAEPTDPGPDPFKGRSYSDMSRDEVEQANQWARDKRLYDESHPQGDTSRDDFKADMSNPDWWPPKDKGVSKSVSPPLDLGGGHKPPVGPDIRDLIGKPNIFNPPVLGPGGHVPVPLPDFPKGHVPGPEIKLPNITDLPHPDIQLPEIGRPDIQLPGWLPGQGEQTPQPTDQGTPESYADMLERLRQLGLQAQGAGADEGGSEDAQIAAALGIGPEEITDEIRAWWAARPQPGPQSPQQGDALPPEEGGMGMGAGLQLGPVHLATSMRPPMRMPSSRMETSRRAGWTPRGGGMKRRSSAGTSAMLDV